MERSCSSRWLSTGLAALAAALVAVALLGPLAGGVIRYRVGETVRSQTVGLDLVSIAVVAPLAFAAARLVARRHPAGAALAAGIGAYTAYMFVQYILGPDYAHIDGNNERLFPLALFLFAAGWAVALAGWNGMDVAALRVSPRRSRLLGRVVLPLLALLAFGRYVPALVDWTSSAPKDAGYLAGPGFSWAIATLDLGVLLPLTVLACVGAGSDRPWATRALFVAVTWFALVGTAVASMAVVMYAQDDPAASGSDTVVMSVLGAAFVAAAVVLYRPSFRTGAVLSGRARSVVSGVAGVVGTVAVLGGLGLLADAEGLGAKVSWLDGSPFPNYTVPGLVLLVVVGGGSCAAALTALARSRFAGAAATATGAILLVWGAIETATIGYRGIAQLVMLVLFVIAPAITLIRTGWR